jgi:hypothetical protein
MSGLPTCRGGRRLAALATAGLLSGCSIFSPLPLIELAKAGAGATSAVIAHGPSSARNTVYHEHASVDDVCIEVGPHTTDADVVPALQAELGRHDIHSRLYEAAPAHPPRGAPCRFWMEYAAEIEWGIPPLAGGYSPYLSAASLTLRDADGLVLSTSSYRLDGFFQMGKWSPTRDKLAPVVTALITGFEN